MKKYSLLILILSLSFFTACKNESPQKSSDEKIQTAAQKKSNSITYQVDTAKSKLFWTGSKPTGEHTGTIHLSNGTIDALDNKINSGSFVLDMNTINCTDLEGDSKLSIEAHLKGTEEDGKSDFFDVTEFPTAQFEITKVTAIANNADANCLIYGNLTLKGITKEIGFKAVTNFTQGSLKVTTQEFSINRTDWGIKFMSKNFVEGLKDKFIHDEIKVSIELFAKK